MTVEVDTEFNLGDRVQTVNHRGNNLTGTIEEIEIHVSGAGVADWCYHVILDAPKRRLRYLSESRLRRLGTHKKGAERLPRSSTSQKRNECFSKRANSLLE